jgi:hypothetical protein
MTCPKCNREEAEELSHEVDIGVGFQFDVHGAVCPNCGELSLCSICGAWDFQPHHKWCGALSDAFGVLG